VKVESFNNVYYLVNNAKNAHDVENKKTICFALLRKRTTFA